MKLTLTEPTEKKISVIIPPNYSTWQTIELTYQCAKHCIDNGITGSFIECGVAAGNNLAAMAKAGRHAYGFDSFEGIPWAGPNDKEQPGVGPIDESKRGILESSGVTVHTIENVIKDMEKWNIKNYSLIKGWFQYTVMRWVGEIAVLRLDGDLYDSTMIPLKYLYPHVVDGGILIVDDWNLEGCRMAFDDFFAHSKYSKRPTLVYDNGVTYWQK